MWNIDKDFIFSLWADAADIEPNTLDVLLETANVVCTAYAPPLTGEVIPSNYLVAEIMQARHVWGQLRGGNQNSYGPDGYEIQVYPLVFAARDLLRPKTSPLSRLR